MKQRDRINSAMNDWEADPWDTSDELADAQLVGFALRSEKPIEWVSIRASREAILGIDKQRLLSADAEFYATHDGEEMLLMRLAWHGFPDPPEWRLATRLGDGAEINWSSWGYFADLPAAWKMPDTSSA